MKNSVPAFILAAILLLAACAPQNEAPPSADLSGEWMLSSLNGQEILPGSTVTATFDNGQVGGNASCNSYSGQYNLDGLSISVSTLVQTEMACMNPEGVMDQESQYLQTLSQAATYTISDDQLEIQNAAGETTLAFTRGQ